MLIVGLLRHKEGANLTERLCVVPARPHVVSGSGTKKPPTLNEGGFGGTSGLLDKLNHFFRNGASHEAFFEMAINAANSACSIPDITRS